MHTYAIYHNPNRCYRDPIPAPELVGLIEANTRRQAYSDAKRRLLPYFEGGALHGTITARQFSERDRVKPEFGRILKSWQLAWSNGHGMSFDERMEAATHGDRS